MRNSLAGKLKYLLTLAENGGISSESSSSESEQGLFQDNFEEGWLISNAFTKIMEDNFDTGWQVENIFTELFNEEFSTNWFIDEIFAEKFAEDFQDMNWI